ncbi:unnamed protein product [Prorocentrum cordatum]|uniref:Uncharacterized protein n=1 Tax=Prorocentrum cordatum TaxID=2364126 RepID=A0ABN9YC71_9DINO|nr:unnamed protein product [Polarella glacialis]
MLGWLRRPRTPATHVQGIPRNPRESFGIPGMPRNPWETGGLGLEDLAAPSLSGLHEPWGTPLRAEGTVSVRAPAWGPPAARRRGMGFGGSAPKMLKTGSDSPLVQKIKAYQRMGQAQKEAWHTYCDMNLGGSRDPSRHDEATLQAFISQYGVP